MGLEDLLAISGDDVTMVVLRPIWTVMRGPWVLAILARDSCGLLPIERRLPRIGSPIRPSGRFFLLLFPNTKLLRM